MRKTFTYSVLQYKHSITLGEILNVGILFYFPDEPRFEFIIGDGYRAKAVYPDFDNSLFNSYLKSIDYKVKNHINLFTETPEDRNFDLYIHKNILAQDAAGLVFSSPVTVENVFSNNNQAVAEFSKLFLPGINSEKQVIIKHNEQYIIRKFHEYVFGGNKSLEERFTKDKIVRTKHLSLKFDYSYETGNLSSYIKPVNLDFSEEVHLQTKAATFFGYLTELAKNGPSKNVRYDLLISKPQDNKFKRAYENVLDLLDSAKAPKNLITEDQLEDYSQLVLSEINPN